MVAAAFDAHVADARIQHPAFAEPPAQPDARRQAHRIFRAGVHAPHVPVLGRTVAGVVFRRRLVPLPPPIRPREIHRRRVEPQFRVRHPAAAQRPTARQQQGGSPRAIRAVDVVVGGMRDRQRLHLLPAQDAAPVRPRKIGRRQVVGHDRLFLFQMADRAHEAMLGADVPPVRMQQLDPGKARPQFQAVPEPLFVDPRVVWNDRRDGRRRPDQPGGHCQRPPCATHVHPRPSRHV